MKDEYNLDYSKAKTNRFAEKYEQIRPSVMLDSDVAEVFPDSVSVNEALRFLIRVTQAKQPPFDIQK